jgi:tetratricopeptide (TPR) repeat protein
MFGIKLLTIFKHSLKICLILGIGLTTLSGCASAKMKKVKKWYDQGIYDEVVKSDIDCNDVSKKCFQLKYIRADSYYHLGDFAEASGYSLQAIEMISDNIPQENVRDAYILRSNILSEQYKRTNEDIKKQYFLYEKERVLDKAIETNHSIRQVKMNKEIQNDLQMQLADVLLLEMDYSSSEDIERLHRKVHKLAKGLEAVFKNVGYGKYYSLYAEFKYVIPEIKNWMKGSNSKFTREELLEQLKSIYIDGLALRNTPLYETDYSVSIDQLLSEVDSSMKKLVF